jgi:SAM-dependent methyltransferase
MSILCPVCQAACTGAALRHFSAQAAAQHFVLAEEFPEQHARLLDHIRLLWRGDSCALHACRQCGLQFAWPFVAGDGLFYNLAYPYSDYPKQRWEFDETFRVLQQLPQPQGKVLEIGAGFGYFLRKLAPQIVAVKNVLAIEYNDRARQVLAGLGYAAHGVDVRHSVFDVHRGQVAAVFMFQVLEHIDDLDALMQRLRELLMPGGRIFMAVPNIQRINYNESNGALLDMPPNHISRWTEAAFQALAQRFDCELLEHRVEPTSWRNFMRRDLVYSHMRRAQRSGSWTNRIRAQRRTPLRVALEGVLAAGAAPARAASWMQARAQGVALGDSVLVQLRARAPA